MAIKVAINGFGRIGRLVMRAAAEAKRDDLEFVAINDLGPTETSAHLFAYDSVHGRFPGTVKVEGDTFDMGTGPIKVFAEKDPTKLPWGDLGVDVVLECTGIFTSKDKAKVHLQAGAKKVLISAPATGADLTVVYGVNEDKLTREHQIISNASCTTNCLAPVAHVLHQNFGLERGFMTTVHAYTADQRLQDALHSDLRRARAAALSMIPTSTGAARAVGEVLPDLKGKLDGVAIRVPTPNVSMIDLKFTVSKSCSVQAINDAMKEAAASNRLRGVLAVVEDELVSTDFNHDPHSSSFDLKQTQAVEGKLFRVLSWYDNEWGFSNRMCDTAVALAKTI